MKKSFKPSVLLALLVAILIAFSVSYFSNSAPSTQLMHSGELAVHFLDVGQGDCELILLPNGQTMLIDAGNNSDESFILNYLSSLNIQTIDYLVGTHPHADHIGSVGSVINSLSVKSLYLPNATTDTKTFSDVIKAAENANLDINYVENGTVIYSDDALSITAVAPVYDYPDLNNQSIVLYLTYKKASFLFTGDAEEESENDITSDISADVLKVGHHGSRTSTSQSFLTRVDPMYAVISCGKDNKYGHPHAETLERLENDDVTVYRTDTMGTLICRTNGNGVTDYNWEAKK